MLSIRSLRILTLDIPREPLYSWTTTQKGDVEFGLRNASWFVNQWSAAYAKLPQESRAQVDIQLLLLGDEGEWWKEEPFKSELKTIYSRMPVSPMRDLSILCTADWARFVLAPESFDLARVRSIIEYSVHNHFRLKTSWPDQGKTKILQQCRSLQKLELICHAPADDAIFKWAVQERSGAAAVAANASSISGATKPLGQGRDGLVPLSELKLVLTDFLPSWQDAVFAFGTTLQSLKIKDCNHSNEVDLCVFQDMPVLRCLTLVCPVIKASVAPFSGCPRLTTIYLGNTGRIFNDQDRFGQWDLAQVQVLTLEGSVCRQFNQATLKKMPMLKALVMIDVVDDMHDRGTFAWDMSCWGPFPRLKSLELSALMTKSFCWSMLEQCPALNYLRLDALKMDPEEVEFPPFSQPLAVYPTLRILALNGYPHSNAGLFDQLPRIAPNLGSLTLHSRTPLSSAQRSELNSKFKLLRYTSYLPDEDYW
ncbi:hypothetical protein DFQ27_004121 [Actinomortierella ambigua]|uniref:Uncharacterized protein n=1 Tax=Actinomortierella ambigua TaxID=1343610 RepID=A0A9P6Q2Q1_9FUNG|nr:hypothetical protein DFQ27_004121 [Actinomortierella ambigua]